MITFYILVLLATAVVAFRFACNDFERCVLYSIDREARKALVAFFYAIFALAIGAFVLNEMFELISLLIPNIEVETFTKERPKLVL